jgi:hypothetical protein
LTGTAFFVMELNICPNLKVAGRALDAETRLDGEFFKRLGFALRIPNTRDLRSPSNDLWIGRPIASK